MKGKGEVKGGTEERGEKKVEWEGWERYLDRQGGGAPRGINDSRNYKKNRSTNKRLVARSG